MENTRRIDVSAGRESRLLVENSSFARLKNIKTKSLITYPIHSSAPPLSCPLATTNHKKSFTFFLFSRRQRSVKHDYNITNMFDVYVNTVNNLKIFVEIHITIINITVTIYFVVTKIIINSINSGNLFVLLV